MQSSRVFINMKVNRYFIWTMSLEDSNKVIKTLSPHYDVIVSISNLILCIETDLTVNKIRCEVGEEMDLTCLEIDDKFLKKIASSILLDEERKNFNRFLRLTNTPNTIDEVLDLILERGGVEHLSEREIKTLDRLTNKPN